MLIDTVRARIERYRANRLVVGYSGGVDSHVLLRLTHLCAFDAEVRAIHVNHGLSPNCDAWQAHCEAVCEALGIPIETHRVSIEIEGSLEEKARVARYRVFENAIDAGDLLLLAHHADDQVETALLGLFRGSAHPGVVGMPVERAVGRGLLLRPLIDIRRREIESWAREEGLEWVADESNDDRAFSRNFIRHDVIPLVETRWRQAPEMILKAIDRDLEYTQLIDSIAESDLDSIRAGAGLAVDGLAAMAPVRRRNVVRYWIASLGLPLPSEAALGSELASVLTAAQDAAPLLTWQGVCLRRFDRKLYLTGAIVDPEPGSDEVFEMKGGESLAMSTGELSAESVEGRGMRSVGETVKVGFRHGGERIRLGRNRSLKNVMQEAGVPPWLRPIIPLVYREDELVALPALPQWGVAMQVAEGFAAEAGQTGLEFTFEMPNQPYSD